MFACFMYYLQLNSIALYNVLHLIMYHQRITFSGKLDINYNIYLSEFHIFGIVCMWSIFFVNFSNATDKCMQNWLKIRQNFIFKTFWIFFIGNIHHINTILIKYSYMCLVIFRRRYVYLMFLLIETRSFTPHQTTKNITVYAKCNTFDWNFGRVYNLL